jgi:dipeptidase D
MIGFVLAEPLGADNGLIMAILESTNIPHLIEALFTIDEETGMTGALNLKEESCNKSC